MKKVFVMIMIIQGSFVAGFLHAQHEGHGAGVQEQKKIPEPSPQAAREPLYYCPMHPTYTADKPGTCPICNMSLVVKEKKDDAEMSPNEKGVQINSYRQQLIGVKTALVGYHRLVQEIRTVGRVAYDPDLYAAQQEYIEAVTLHETLKRAGNAVTRGPAGSLVQAARLKLELGGLVKEDIERLEKTMQNDQTLLQAVPGSGVWIYAPIYEYELSLVLIGAEARIRAAAYPEKMISGKVVSLLPVFDERTRSVTARIRVDAPEVVLQPNMFVDVFIQTDAGAHLAVPKEAVMDSGLRRIVYVALEGGYFEPRQITAGIVTDTYVQVVEGLDEGDSVVVSGNFLVDAESKLNAALESTGHYHGE